jgi:hypothetical protein
MPATADYREAPPYSLRYGTRQCSARQRRLVPASIGLMDRFKNPAVALWTDHAIDHRAALRRLELRAFTALFVAVRVTLVSHSDLGDLHHGNCADWIGADTSRGSNYRDRAQEKIAPSVWHWAIAQFV